MSTPVENNTTADTQDDAGLVPAETEETTGTTDRGTGAEVEDGPSREDLEKMLKAARDEAAKYRITARETREALEKAKSPEDYEAIVDRATKAEEDLAKANLAAKYNLPADLAKRIQGTTEEEREADAKSLASLISAPSTLGTGGLSPGVKAPVTDPRELANRIPRSRR